MFAFLVPIVLYVLFVAILVPSPNSGFVFVGIVGCLILGFGMISLTGLLDGLYFGHIITSAGIGTGVVLITISSIIMYTPSLYLTINEQFVSFYFLIWLALIISAIWYVFFRMGISRILRKSGISRTAVKKSKKGIKNYWWYESVNEMHNLGWLYYVNKCFTVVYTVAILCHLLIGWCRVASPLVLSLTCIICILDVTLWFPVFLTQGSKTGKKQRTDTMGIVSVLGFLFPLFICLALILYFLKV